jgi:vacuolar-type H+-ATPase subunit I/STV1
MSIVRLKKMTICGLIGEKNLLLEDLQKLGCMHLMPLAPPQKEVEKTASSNADTAYKALKFLKDEKYKRRQVADDPSFNVTQFVNETLDLKQKLRDSMDLRDFLKSRIDVLKPWGSISFPPHETLEGLKLWFYELPVKHLGLLKNIDIPWEITHKTSRIAFLVLISKEEPEKDILPVQRIHTGAKSSSELKKQLETVESDLEDIVAHRQLLTRNIYLLSLNIAEADNLASIQFAQQQTLDDDSLVIIQAWVPVDDVTDVTEYCDDAQLAYLIEEPTENDNPPTLIKQPKVMKAGVDLAMFYKVPKYTSWDPSLLLVSSFAIFFAMILADTGYGVVLLMLLLPFWKKMGQSESGRAYRYLGMILVTTTIIYGVLVGSYFGYKPATDSLLSHLQLVSINDFDSMMKISIIIGVIHIVFANAMMAYQSRMKIVMLSKIGWIIVVLAGLCYWLANGNTENEAVIVVAQTMALVGVLLITLFTSERPLNKPTDYAWRLFDGVCSLNGLMGLFGDVLSYMRLFALGLASSSLAMTFNELASSAYASLPGLGFLAAILILIIGHALNFALSLISGVVHGLRLNFIEFYKWGLPEEGFAFQNFSRKEVKK